LVVQFYPVVVFKLFWCSFATVFSNFWVWTIFTAPFYRPFQGGLSFLFVLFEVWMGMMYYPQREKDLGSLTFTLWVLLVNGIVNLVYLLAMFLLGTFVNGQYKMTPASGMWPMILLCITLRCLGDPTGSTNFWGLVNIPNTWYPAALGAFFCLLGFRIDWSIVAALVVGYGYPFIQLERLLPSRDRAGRWETRLCGSAPRSCIGGAWVYAGDTNGSYRPSYTPFADLGRATGADSLVAQARNARFEAFAGTGNRLGDGNDTGPSTRGAVELPLTSTVPDGV
jgi:hypothetical protein